MDVHAVADSVSAVPSDSVPAGITWLVRRPYYAMNAPYPTSGERVKQIAVNDLK